MSAIRTAFTDLSLVSVDAGYLVLMADLDGYLKVKDSGSNVINVSKTLNYFTQSDSGNYLRWVNPNYPGLEIMNGTVSFLSGSPVCGSVFTSGDESFIAGVQSSSGVTSSVIAYANVTLYSNYVKANDNNVAVKYVDLTTSFDQGVEVDYTGTRIVGLTANSDVSLTIDNSIEDKFSFHNDGNLKMRNNIGEVYFNGLSQSIVVSNPLATPNSHIFISASYSWPATPLIGWVEKGNGTFSVNDKNGQTMSYSYLIINPI